MAMAKKGRRAVRLYQLGLGVAEDSGLERSEDGTEKSPPKVAKPSEWKKGIGRPTD